jgi:ribose transport system permease protein
MSATTMRTEAGSLASTRLLRLLRDNGVLLVLLVLCVVFAFNSTAFLTVDNIRVLVQNAALPTLIACGVTVGILAGQFDLSVGGIFGFSGVISVMAMNQLGLPAAIAAGILTGVALGAVNGLFVAVVGIQSFLVTLATGFAFIGLGLVITGGTGIRAADSYEAFSPLAQGTIATVQYRVWIVGIIVIVLAAVLARARWGKQIYAVGGSIPASRVAGVRVRLVVFSALVVSGACAGLAGVIGASDAGAAQSNGGVGMEFAAITAVIVGGTSLVGGRGSVWRTVVGVMLLAVIANGFTLLYIDPLYNSLVEGVIILLAIAIEARLRELKFG